MKDTCDHSISVSIREGSVCEREGYSDSSVDSDCERRDSDELVAGIGLLHSLGRRQERKSEITNFAMKMCVKGV